jgi:hypothetical protein
MSITDYYLPIIFLILLVLIIPLVLFFTVGNKGCVNRLTRKGKPAFCGCKTNKANKIEDIKFDGTSPVAGFFYQLQKPEGTDFSDITIDLYADDDRFEGKRPITESMVWWMDFDGISHWVQNKYIYTDLINKCYPRENPVTDFDGDGGNNRRDWTIMLTPEKSREAIEAMENGSFAYGLTIARYPDTGGGIDDLKTWKCCV